MIAIFRWNGKYFGFIRNGYFFDAQSNYLGWLDQSGEVWRADGQYLGELTKGTYILRRKNMMPRMSRMPRMQPMTPMIPMARMNRMAKMELMSFQDALDQFGSA